MVFDQIVNDIHSGKKLFLKDIEKQKWRMGMQFCNYVFLMFSTYYFIIWSNYYILYLFAKIHF